MTQQVRLLTLPDERLDLHDNGRCRDVPAMYELANLHKNRC
ncbi:MAG: hypothetical protein HZA63_14580 [Rhodocyclales bacterium]|nr:hypothetical protein [Rhodocyclales bacterium]